MSIALLSSSGELSFDIVLPDIIAIFEVPCSPASFGDAFHRIFGKKI